MKKLLAALTLALLCSVALAVSAANATHSNGQGPKHDFVSGTSKFDAFGIEAQFHLNAKSGPAGEDPQGHFIDRQKPFAIDDLNFMGRVTCLTVNGNTAVAGGEVTKSEFPFPAEGSGFLVQVIDSGSSDTEDLAGNFFLPAPPPEGACPAGFSVPFHKGNFIVHDATP